MEPQPGSSLLGKEEQPLYPPSSDERTLSLLSHILTLVGGFIPPLIIFLIKKDDSSFVRSHSLESLNFQITVTIIGIILAITIVGILLIWVVLVAEVILVIVATIRASESKLYRYPFNFRLIK
ncbi:MAG: DUF4870 domain-containing protein [Bacteroidetes bacterium]|nr:MAG: DUF4870 domain-containing protein [Bacteroidota bacterium]